MESLSYSQSSPKLKDKRILLHLCTKASGREDVAQHAPGSSPHMKPKRSLCDDILSRIVYFSFFTAGGMMPSVSIAAPLAKIADVKYP